MGELKGTFLYRSFIRAFNEIQRNSPEDRRMLNHVLKIVDTPVLRGDYQDKTDSFLPTWVAVFKSDLPPPLKLKLCDGLIDQCAFGAVTAPHRRNNSIETMEAILYNSTPEYSLSKIHPNENVLAELNKVCLKYGPR